MNTKIILRKKIYAARNTHTPAWIRRTSLPAEQRVIALDRFETANSVFCYVSSGPEVETDAIISQCRKTGKPVFVPAYNKTTGKYGITEADENTEWASGHFKIPEPVHLKWIEKNYPTPLLCIVPGLAFGKDCSRVGHGKGIYDRLLRQSALERCLKIGLAFEFQVFDTTPVDRHDVMMDMVVTEKTVYTITAKFG